MKKTLLSALAIFAFKSLVVAQSPLLPLLNIENTWVSEHSFIDIRNNINTNVDSYQISIDDTLISGKKYFNAFHKFKYLKYESDVSNKMITVIENTKSYFRQNGDTLFYYDTKESKEKISFYFTGTEKGDTIIFSEDQIFYNKKEIITSVDTAVYGDIKRRNFHIQNNILAYVDGIGFTGGGIKPQIGHWFEESILLKCATIGETTFEGVLASGSSGIDLEASQDNLFADKCFEVTSTRNKVNTGSEFYLTRLNDGNFKLMSSLNKPFKVLVFNTNGIKIFDKTGTSDLLIETSELPTGLYILQASDDDSNYYQGKIIK
ncbi:MAG: T9SS type A sorting domain-containing protein [Sporocytophaga sp.]|uniref:T9SS type A sorting domain-containing protein n=1 Tax=Sporocytophaga sp. TaxID=2231183 RepID=UPI001B23A413|nr:T9SS type A sorting domain-containing protein [Sporocytophaga sp.]MBO9703526.1 T9SS type A sorting domain-containing protein [Sporocytophaga sp.]